MTVTSDFYADVYSKSFGLRPDQMLVTGYPKVDLLFHPVEGWREKFGVPEADKYVFWLPTFRTTGCEGLKNLNETAPSGTTGLPVIESKQELEELNRYLHKQNMVLLLKLHPFQNRELIADWELSNIRILENSQFLEEDLQINELLGYADALISDYSSAAIDYLVLDRPMAFTLDDYESYGESRGFNWPNVRDYLPGKEIFTFGDFLAFLEELAEGEDSGRQKRTRLRAEFQKYADDKNSERVFRRLKILQ